MSSKTTKKQPEIGLKSMRAPIIAVMGHIDHGKSSLLDYIRKTNITAKEAGGITQHVSAYEVVHEAKDHKKHKITFLDTPGHEAFQALRMRGVQIADIAILVVSAGDGVKPQTLDALKCITEAGIPYIIAINKIDLPDANIERTKQSLAENEIFIEGYGGDIPAVAISAKTGEGVNDLLDMMILVAEIADLSADHNLPAEGIVLESHLDAKKGIAATLIVRSGTISQGMFVVANESSSPVRIMENFLGKNIKEATFSSPICIIGWDTLPPVGSSFKTFENRKDAELYIQNTKDNNLKIKKTSQKTKDSLKNEPVIIPIILKADKGGSLEAIMHKIELLKNDQVEFSVIQNGIGAISESDIKLALGNPSSIVIGFHTKADARAINLAERSGIQIQIFDIIYKLLESLEELLEKRKPHVAVEESTGKARIAKIFSITKDKQVVGGKVESGNINVGSQVKILRREAEIGTGKIRGLQKQKDKVSEVTEGSEFGALIEAKIELAPGDRIESVRIVEKQI
jgi:translation initiation factor IF-2